MSTTTVSIIGSSGRNNDPNTHKFTPTVFDAMVSTAKSIIEELEVPKDCITLVSGGAPWSDHVAVALYLAGGYGGLTLYVPAALVASPDNTTEDNLVYRYADTGKVDFRTNPGGTLNYYFRSFSAVMKRDMLSDIGEAIKLGAVVDTDGKTFKQRNTMVSKSDNVIAFTWNETEPKSGGTGDTWSKIPKTSTKYHVCLDSL